MLVSPDHLVGEVCLGVIVDESDGIRCACDETNNTSTLTIDLVGK